MTIVDSLYKYYVEHCPLLYVCVRNTLPKFKFRCSFKVYCCQLYIPRFLDAINQAFTYIVDNGGDRVGLCALLKHRIWCVPSVVAVANHLQCMVRNGVCVTTIIPKKQLFIHQCDQAVAYTRAV